MNTSSVSLRRYRTRNLGFCSARRPGFANPLSDLPLSGISTGRDLSQSRRLRTSSRAVEAPEPRTGTHRARTVRFYEVDLEQRPDGRRPRNSLFINCDPTTIAPVHNADGDRLAGTELKDGDEILLTDHEGTSRASNELERM